MCINRSKARVSASYRVARFFILGNRMMNDDGSEPQHDCGFQRHHAVIHRHARDSEKRANGKANGSQSRWLNGRISRRKSSYAVHREDACNFLFCAMLANSLLYCVRTRHRMRVENTSGKSGVSNVVRRSRSSAASDGLRQTKCRASGNGGWG